MGNSAGDRKDWPVILSGCVGTAAGIILARLALDSAGIKDFWPGMIATVCGVVIGLLVGQLVGRMLSRRPPGS